MSAKKSHDDLFVIDGIRTPFAKAQGELAALPADELGRIVLRGLLDRSGIDPSRLDEVVLGCVGQNARAANIARVAALRAGVPESVPALTVHRNCASGMESIAEAALRVSAGRASLLLVGGTESMSQYPLEFSAEMTAFFGRLNRARSLGARLGVLASFRPRFLKPRIALLEGLTDPVCGLNMGETAELIAREAGIDREAQDRYALESHRKAAAAVSRLAEEIVPVVASGLVLSRDGCVRPEQSQEALARLRPVFDRRFGTVTAGNACPVTDGAAALLVGTEGAAREQGLQPIGRVVDWQVSGLDPRRMGLGPVHAIAGLLRRTGLKMEDIDLFEVNEAFSAQVLACQAALADAAFCRRQLGLDLPLGPIPGEKLNVNGGAVAIGHPVGASGTRLVLTLLRELRRRRLRRGIASLCVGGGQGAAFLLEV